MRRDPQLSLEEVADRIHMHSELIRAVWLDVVPGHVLRYVVDDQQKLEDTLRGVPPALVRDAA